MNAWWCTVTRCCCVCAAFCSTALHGLLALCPFLVLTIPTSLSLTAPATGHASLAGLPTTSATPAPIPASLSAPDSSSSISTSASAAAVPPSALIDAPADLSADPATSSVSTGGAYGGGDGSEGAGTGFFPVAAGSPSYPPPQPSHNTSAVSTAVKLLDSAGPATFPDPSPSPFAAPPATTSATTATACGVLSRGQSTPMVSTTANSTSSAGPLAAPVTRTRPVPPASASALLVDAAPRPVLRSISYVPASPLPVAVPAGMSGKGRGAGGNRSTVHR